MTIQVQCVFTSPDRYRIELSVGPRINTPPLHHDDVHTTGLLEFKTWDDTLEHVRRITESANPLDAIR